jgi:hypothetical protein
MVLFCAPFQRSALSSRACAGNDDVASFMRALGYAGISGRPADEDMFARALAATAPSAVSAASPWSRALAEATHARLSEWRRGASGVAA